MRKKKTHRVYAFFVLLFAVLIIAASLFLLFYIQDVKVSGNEYCTEQEIIDTVQNDKYSVNSLYILAKYALGRGDRLPCLDSLKVSLDNPWTLHIHVKEKQIVGCVKMAEKYYFFDQDGMIVLIGEEARENVPMVEGVEIDQLELYKKLKDESTQIYEEILEASQEMQRRELSVDRILCKKDHIYIYMGRICISLGNDVTSLKIAQIPNIMKELQDQEGTLHLENFSESGGTITFTPGQFPQEN